MSVRRLIVASLIVAGVAVEATLEAHAQPFAPERPRRLLPAVPRQLMPAPAPALNTQAGAGGSNSDEQALKRDVNAAGENVDAIAPDSDQAKSDSSFSVTPDGIPALNIVPAVERPPLPPPPATAALRPNGNGQPSPPQAWRAKAHQLFKQKLEANIIAVNFSAPYESAMSALRQAASDEGLTVTGFSQTSGHMLITYSDSAAGATKAEKVIIAMRPILEGQTNGTEARISCETRNRNLTAARMKEIVTRLENNFGVARKDANQL